MERSESDKLSIAQIEDSLTKLPDWVFDRDAIKIQKTFVRNNFMDAISFIRKIADLAEAQDHHPDILLSGYKNVTIMLTTHSAKGVTQNDLDLARAIEQL